MIQKQFENIGRELRDSILLVLRDYSEALLLAIFMAIILRSFVFSAYKVVNLTMEPNLKLGDFIVGFKIPYGFQIPLTQVHIGKGEPKRNEVLIFSCPNQRRQSCIKRVIGIAGDRVEIRGKKLILNGKMAKYVKSNLTPKTLVPGGQALIFYERWGRFSRPVLVTGREEGENFGPYIVPPGHFFALGDHRDHSEDSRHWGGVPYENIEARASLVWFSVEWLSSAEGGFDSRVRWERLFQWVR